MTSRAGYAHTIADAWVPPEPTPCRDNPDAWYSPNVINRGGGGNRSLARALCAPCGHRGDCVAAAMRAEAGKPVGERHGVWGGLLPVERARLDRGEAA